jgi:hypothetical protein
VLNSLIESLSIKIIPAKELNGKLILAKSYLSYCSPIKITRLPNRNFVKYTICIFLLSN